MPFGYNSELKSNFIVKPYTDVEYHLMWKIFINNHYGSSCWIKHTRMNSCGHFWEHDNVLENKKLTINICFIFSLYSILKILVCLFYFAQNILNTRIYNLLGKKVDTLETFFVGIFVIIIQSYNFITYIFIKAVKKKKFCLCEICLFASLPSTTN